MYGSVWWLLDDVWVLFVGLFYCGVWCFLFFFFVYILFFFFFFFFQAEDGIRDLIVTGVQTCALPILVTIIAKDATTADGLSKVVSVLGAARGFPIVQSEHAEARVVRKPGDRSEERRVGKECRSRWSG